VGRATRQVRPTALVAVGLSLALVAGACGTASDDDGATPIGAPAPDRTAVPLGTSPRAVVPYLEDLLETYNGSVNEISAAPTSVLDVEGPAARAYLDVFEPGSDVAAQAIAHWHDQGVIGESTRPYDAERPAFVTSLDGEVETISEDEVTFPTCNELAFETVNAAGQRVDVEPGASVPGMGTAVRVGDGWLLRRLDRYEGVEGCDDAS
jgi:hypothetical protein